jgi:DNA polymerase-3 subunit gamma/tau
MSYQVIARKYRPQTFDDVVGQGGVTGTLKNAILHDRVAHGYIFSGARGVGKTTTARILAKALNCAQGPTVTPDGTCDSCREITAGNSVDVIEIDAASNRGIDEIRELRETARYLPARDRYKVFIIDEAHMLTNEAFNALLKTLEEPPPRCLFILATTEAHKLPTTIQSRCQHFAFRLLDYSEVVARLNEVCVAEKVEADEGSLAALAEAAAGSLRDALSMLDQVIAGCGEKLVDTEVQRLLGVVPGRLLIEIVEAIVAADAERVLGQIQRLAAEGYEPAAFLGDLTRFIRNLMVARSVGIESPLIEVPGDMRATLGRLAGSLAEEDWLRAFQILLRAQSDLRYALQPRFHLELALLKLVHARRLISLENVLAELKESGPAPGRAVGSVPAPARPTSSGGTGYAPPARTAPSAAPTTTSSRTSVQTGAQMGAQTGTQTRAQTGAPTGAPAITPAVTPAGSPTSRTGAAAVPAQAPATQADEPLRAETPQDPRLAEVKRLLFEQSKKFVSSCLEHVAEWRAEAGAVHFVFSRQNSGSFWADVLNNKENQEALRQVCSQVLGEPVSIRVTLRDEEVRPARAVPDARGRAASDPVVRAFEQRFECVWLEVEDLRGY